MSGGGQVLQEDFLPAAQKMGASQVLHKPFNASELLGIVSEILVDRELRASGTG